MSEDKNCDDCEQNDFELESAQADLGTAMGLLARAYMLLKPIAPGTPVGPSLPFKLVRDEVERFLEEQHVLPGGLEMYGDPHAEAKTILEGEDDD
jgi:hypothetical protein